MSSGVVAWSIDFSGLSMGPTRGWQVTAIQTTSGSFRPTTIFVSADVSSKKNIHEQLLPVSSRMIIVLFKNMVFLYKQINSIVCHGIFLFKKLWQTHIH